MKQWLDSLDCAISVMFLRLEDYRLPKIVLLAIGDFSRFQKSRKTERNYRSCIKEDLKQFDIFFEY
jgi:hypothetical protein